MKGILVDNMNESLQNRMGMSITHKGYPWARAQVFVKDGTADAFVTVPTPARKKYTRISDEPVITGKVTLFSSKKNPAIARLETVTSTADLRPFRQVQYLGNGWAKKNIGDMNVRWVPTLSDTLKLLSTGKFDVFVSVSQVVNFNLKKLGYKNQLVEIPVVLSRSPFHLCIRKTSEHVEILEKFDETIRTMRLDGSLEKIYDTYR